MEKVKYEIDPYNRLVIIDKPTDINSQRRVLDGVFSLDAGNQLAYHIKSPLPESAPGARQIKLKGSWSLTKDHDLRFTLDKSARRGSDALTLSGDIIDVRGNSILFSVTTRRENGSQATYVLELSGAWQADGNNRLAFRVKRERGTCDILTLEGAWEVGNNNEIVYRYEKSRLARRKKLTHTIIFRGRWRVTKRAVLSYVLDMSTDSTFDFRASLGICGDDFIKYSLGAGAARILRPAMRTVTLFGVWRIKKGSCLTFEVEYADGTVYSIAFGAEARLTAKDTISLRLKDVAAKKDIGLRLELSHAMLQGDGNIFLRMLKSKEKSVVLIGAGLRW